MGILRVYINPPADMSKAKAVWSLDRQQGDFWVEGRTPIGNASTALVRGSFSKVTLIFLNIWRYALPI